MESATETTRIHNSGQFHQRCVFDSLVFDGKYSPTDIDAVLDCHGKVFLFTEAKHVNSRGAIPTGQRLAIENLCNAINMGGMAIALGIIALHSTPEGQDIDLGHAVVHQIYDGREWKKPRAPTNVHHMHQWALRKAGMIKG